MSKFLSAKYKNLVPYTPGEQPTGMEYVKLNTNESPFPPSQKAQQAAEEAAKLLQLYPDPECKALNKKLGEVLGVKETQVISVNGSDEVLNFAFMAYCDDTCPAVFPDITYGFYKVFAEINRVPYKTFPLNEDFTVNAEDYINAEGTLFIANPNAPTGLALPLSDIERIVASDPHRMVVVDEAYVDFGGESAVSLIDKYDNLLITQTFSKSRSMAGARMGFGVANEEIIRDLNTVRYSTNPYNINRMTAAAAIGTLEDEEYTRKNCAEIIKTREYTVARLQKLGFSMTDSKTNFIFAQTQKIEGKKLYQELKNRGVLVRHFDTDRLRNFNRITVGSKEQMDKLLDAIKDILEEA